MPITPLQSTPSKLPTIIAAIICMSIALWSALWFWSSVLIVRPEVVIMQWEQNKVGIDQELAVKMIARLKQSILLNPMDANSHFILARFYEQLVISETNKKPQKHIRLAENEYKEAISSEPTNGYLWARLANFYSIISPINQKLINALDLAIQYRKYERETQEVIIPLLLKHWYELPIKTQHQSKNLIRHAFKHPISARSLLLQAKKTNTLIIITPLLTKKRHKTWADKYQKQLANEGRNDDK